MMISAHSHPPRSTFGLLPFVGPQAYQRSAGNAPLDISTSSRVSSTASPLAFSDVRFTKLKSSDVRALLSPSEGAKSEPTNPSNKQGQKRWFDVVETKDLDKGGWRPTPKMPRKFFVVGNWKCHGNRSIIESFVESLNKGQTVQGRGVEVVMAPPAVYADYVRYLLRKDFGIASQNCWTGPPGAFTGEIPADMLADSFSDCSWVILGHSDRRRLPFIGESDETVATKVAYALSKGLGVIVCIGETAEERNAGTAIPVIEKQLTAIARKVTNWDNVIIAYEPAWATHTVGDLSPEEAQKMHHHIRQWIATTISPKVAEKVRIIYGGPATGTNCNSLAKQPDIDGFLAGAAPLSPDFLSLVDSWQVKLEM